MLTTQQIQEAAQALHHAEKTRTQIRPTSTQYPEMTLEDAYAIQAAWLAIKLAEGQTIIGRKIGLTSRAMQDVMGIEEPDFGTLLDDMLFPEGLAIEAGQFTDPKLEVELAFVLKDALQGEKVTLFDVLNATDYVVPALEIIAARSTRVDPETGKQRGVLDTISDNAANAGIILGGRPIKPMDTDLRWAAALLYKNGVIEETGVAAGVLNHPANSLAWLVRRFSQYGISLKRGDVILSGSFTRPVAVAPGDTIHADYGKLGGVSCRFI